MFSPRSKERQDTGSFSNSHKTNSDLYFTRRLASDVVDERGKSHGQLEAFYMPYLKKIFEDNRVNNPTLRSPEEFIFSSRLLELRQSEIKRKIDYLQKENDHKDKVIAQLNNKLISAVEKLRVYEPTVSVGEDMPFSTFEEADKKVKKIQNLLKIKNEETFFRLRLKAMSLLEEFNLTKEDTQGMNQLDSESSLFEFTINKIKSKIREFKAKSKEISDKNQKERLEVERLQDDIRQMYQTSELLRNNERRLKDRLDQIKKEWSASNEKLIIREKDVENMDVEIFRLKRLLEEKDSLLLKSSTNSYTKTAIADDLKKEYQQQIRDQRTLLTSYNIEINDLKQQLEYTQGELEETMIRDKFNVEEKERVSREYMRWKERYEWFEKEKEGKQGFYEERNKALEGELEKLKNEIAEVQSVDVLNNSRNIELRNTVGTMSIELTARKEEIMLLMSQCSRLEEEKRARQNELENSPGNVSDVALRKTQDELERRLVERELYFNNLIQELNHDWQERYLIKEEKHYAEIAQLQNEMRRSQETPQIRKKAEYMQHKTSLEPTKPIHDKP